MQTVHKQELEQLKENKKLKQTYDNSLEQIKKMEKEVAEFN